MLCVQWEEDEVVKTRCVGGWVDAIHCAGIFQSCRAWDQPLIFQTRFYEVNETSLFMITFQGKKTGWLFWGGNSCKFKSVELYFHMSLSCSRSQSWEQSVASSSLILILHSSDLSPISAIGIFLTKRFGQELKFNCSGVSTLWWFQPARGVEKRGGDNLTYSLRFTKDLVMANWGRAITPKVGGPTPRRISGPDS